MIVTDEPPHYSNIFTGRNRAVSRPSRPQPSTPSLPKSLIEGPPFAESIETTRCGQELAQIAPLETGQSRTVLDTLLSRARTLKESSTLLALAREALLTSD